MTPVELSRTVLRAVRCAVDEGELRVSVPERAVVTVPGPGGCGDFATNIALQLARPAGQPARRVAEILRPRLVAADGVGDVVVTGPGFLNISLRQDADAVAGLVREILARGAAYGHGTALAGQVIELRVPYEVRAEVVADALVRVAATQGARVEVVHGEPVSLRPVPAPEDPAPLGPDAARWALLHPAPHDRPRVTADHLVQREGNPLFRVRYAHARIRALGRNAARLGFGAEAGDPAYGSDDSNRSNDSNGFNDGSSPDRPEHSDSPHGPNHGSGHNPSHGQPATPDVRGSEAAPVGLGSEARQADRAGHRTNSRTGPHRVHPAAAPATAAARPGTGVRLLLAALADHPRVLASAVTRRAPDRLARHLVVVADAVLPLLGDVLPKGEEKPSAAHRARLALAEAAGTVLAGGLSLLGIDAPEHL